MRLVLRFAGVVATLTNGNVARTILASRSSYALKTLMIPVRVHALTTGNDISKGSFAIISVRSALGGAYDILHAALCERANDLHNFRRRQRIMHDRQQKNTHKHFDPNDEDDRLHIASELKEPESLLGSVLGVSREMIKRRTEVRTNQD